MAEPTPEEVQSWRHVELVDGIQDSKTGEVHKEVFMRKTKGKDTLDASRDMRVTSDSDPMAGFILLTRVCKLKIGENEFRNLTVKDLEEMSLEDIGLLNDLLGEINNIALERTGFLSRRRRRAASK